MFSFQSQAIDDCSLSTDRIDIWQFQLDHLPKDAISILDEEEKVRANRFHFAHHRRRFIVARAMLRIILGRYLQKKADELKFTYNSHGKPSVENQMNLEFNLSHSEDLALLAIGQKFPLGIDLEFFSARPYRGIANNSFSSKEYTQFSKLPHYIEPLSFFHIWAQKEALIKACGLGLSYPTKQFDVSILPPTNESIADTLHQTNWQITSFMPKIACCAALCHKPDIKNFSYVVVNPLNFFM